MDVDQDHLAESLRIANERIETLIKDLSRQAERYEMMIRCCSEENTKKNVKLEKSENWETIAERFWKVNTAGRI